MNVKDKIVSILKSIILPSLSGGIVHDHELPEICFLVQVYIWIALYMIVLVPIYSTNSLHVLKATAVGNELLEWLLTPQVASIACTTIIESFQNNY